MFVFTLAPDGSMLPRVTAPNPTFTAVPINVPVLTIFPTLETTPRFDKLAVLMLMDVLAADIDPTVIAVAVILSV